MRRADVIMKAGKAQQSKEYAPNRFQLQPAIEESYVTYCMGQQIPRDSNTCNMFPVSYETGIYITSVTRTRNIPRSDWLEANEIRSLKLFL
jgi:hypothetical protein